MNRPLLALSFDRLHRVLLVRYAMVFSLENLAQLDDAISAFVAREGLTTVIVDFSDVPAGAIDPALMRARGGKPSLVPGQPRVFISPNDSVFGMLRIYGAYQETTPVVVRTLDAALSALQIDPKEFKPVLA